MATGRIYLCGDMLVSLLCPGCVYVASLNEW